MEGNWFSGKVNPEVGERNLEGGKCYQSINLCQKHEQDASK